MIAFELDSRRLAEQKKSWDLGRDGTLSQAESELQRCRYHQSDEAYQHHWGLPIIPRAITLGCPAPILVCVVVHCFSGVLKSISYRRHNARCRRPRPRLKPVGPVGPVLSCWLRPSWLCSEVQYSDNIIIISPEASCPIGITGCRPRPPAPSEISAALLLLQLLFGKST